MTGTPQHLVYWTDEPVDCSEAAKANPYIDPWKVPAVDTPT